MDGWVDDRIANYIQTTQIYNVRVLVGYKLNSPHIQLHMRVGEKLYLATLGSSTLQDHPSHSALASSRQKYNRNISSSLIATMMIGPH